MCVNVAVPRWFIRALVSMAAVVMAVPAQASPRIQHWTLDNGVRVYFVEAHEIPMVQARLSFDAGAARDPNGRNGLAMMTAALLKDGTAQMNADQVAAAFEDLGAEFSASSERDTANVNLTSLSDAALLNPAVETLRKLLQAPAFPTGALERERQRALVGLRQRDQSPGDLASREFMRRLYGKHPYANDPAGEVDTLTALKREDLLAYYQRYYVGSNAVLALVGDLSSGEARKLARELAGQLPKGEPPPALPPVTDAEPGRETIAFPSSQSHVYMGEVGMSRNDPDYFPLYVGNYILGGSGLVSRLADEVRERRGLSYSVYSYFWPMAGRGPFIVGLQTKNEQRKQAEQVMAETVQKFVENGPTDAELEAAKKNLTGGFPLRIDSNRKIADQLTVIGFYRLPLDYLDTYIARIQAVTADQVRDAFRRRIHPARMLTVVVGGSAS